MLDFIKRIFGISKKEEKELVDPLECELIRTNLDYLYSESNEIRLFLMGIDREYYKENDEKLLNILLSILSQVKEYIGMVCRADVKFSPVNGQYNLDKERFIFNYKNYYICIPEKGFEISNYVYRHRKFLRKYRNENGNLEIKTKISGRLRTAEYDLEGLVHNLTERFESKTFCSK